MNESIRKSTSTCDQDEKIIDAPCEDKRRSGETEIKKLALVLSGGGFRATIFHLGVLIRLAELDRIKDIEGIVSVSGGSILAGHFIHRWDEAVYSDEGFISVAADLINFCRKNIRDSVFTPWLWSRLIPFWNYKKLSRTAFLERAYRKHFGNFAFSDLPDKDVPFLAMVSTDAVMHELVVFTSNGIYRFPKSKQEGQSKTNPILIKGVSFSLAIAASSSVPPVFRRMVLNHKDLGLTYEEFKSTLNLNDGGVFDNLGIKTVLSLRLRELLLADLYLICDAERAQDTKPKLSAVKTDVLGQSIELSEARKEHAKKESEFDFILIRLSDRTQCSPGLPFQLQTLLHGFRTDLNALSWQEINALIKQGAATVPTAVEGAETEHQARLIQEILKKAGHPDPTSNPSERDLKNSSKSYFGHLLIHGFIALTLLLLIVCLASFFVINFTQSGIGDRPNPPEDIPFMDQDLPPLTDEDRSNKDFTNTKITILNNSDKAIVLAYTYVPQSDGNELSRYGHRESGQIEPGKTLHDTEINFGGPYHLSVFADGKWLKMDKWFDLGIVAERTIVVDNASGQFRCNVLFRRGEE